MTKDTFLPNYIEISPLVSAKKIFKVFYIDTYIGKISPAPWRPCFLTNPNGLKNLGRGSPKRTFLQNYMEIGPVVWDKMIFTFFYIQSNPS